MHRLDRQLIELSELVDLNPFCPRFGGPGITAERFAGITESHQMAADTSKNRKHD